GALVFDLDPTGRPSRMRSEHHRAAAPVRPYQRQRLGHRRINTAARTLRRSLEEAIVEGQSPMPRSDQQGSVGSDAVDSAENRRAHPGGELLKLPDSPSQKKRSLPSADRLFIQSAGLVEQLEKKRKDELGDPLPLDLPA